MTHKKLLAIIMGIGALSRLAVLFFVPIQRFPDAETYLRAGKQLFSSGIIDAINVMPLYPVLTFLVGGGIGVMLMDIGFSVVTIWLIYLTVIEIFHDRFAAHLAALAAAIYPHFLFYAVSGVTETSYVFLVCAAFLLLYRGQFLIASVLIVLSILERPVLALWAPLLITVFARFAHKLNWREILRHLLFYFAIYIALMLPWWIHNYAKYGQFVHLNLADGSVLYAGNNPLNTSGGGISGKGAIKGIDVDFSAFDSISDPIVRNRALKQAALDFIANNPNRFLQLAVKKFLRFWRLWPYAGEYESWYTIIISLLSYGVVSSLSLVLLVREIRTRWRILSPILFFAAYMTAVHMVTIASVRYRLPLEPFLIVLGAYQAACILRSAFGEELLFMNKLHSRNVER